MSAARCSDYFLRKDSSIDWMIILDYLLGIQAHGRICWSVPSSFLRSKKSYPNIPPRVSWDYIFFSKIHLMKKSGFKTPRQKCISLENDFFLLFAAKSLLQPQFKKPKAFLLSSKSSHTNCQLRIVLKDLWHLFSLCVVFKHSETRGFGPFESKGSTLIKNWESQK